MPKWDIVGFLYVGFIIAIIAFWIFSVAAFLIVPTMNPEPVTITITEKIPYHDGSYLVICKVGDTEEVLRIGDVWLLGIFDSSDRYAYLKTGETYKVQVAGYRVPILSWYRNINVIEGR